MSDSEKHHQEIQREPRSTEWSWQTQEKKSFKDFKKKRDVFKDLKTTAKKLVNN